MVTVTIEMIEIGNQKIAQLAASNLRVTHNVVENAQVQIQSPL